MNLPQENLDAAQRSARRTLHDLEHPVTLRRLSNQQLETMLWDLEAIGAALRLELLRRHDPPMDIG